MKTTSTHECPIEGCTARVPNTMLMCGRHWRRVSSPTSRELYAAYREQPRSARHLAAMRAAIDEVQRPKGDLP